MNNWYVLTGGPSSGKTTLLTELKNLGHTVVPEAARTVIDQGLAKGVMPEELRKDEKWFQDEVLRLKVATERELPRSAVTFFDRGMHDTIAYLRHYEYEIEDWIKLACQEASYAIVFLLEPLKVYEKDYARTEHNSFAEHIYHLLRDAYEEASIEVISLPPVSVKERLETILKYSRQEQLV